MIRHSVVFRLKHPSGSEAEAAFLNKAADLAKIEGVQQFECSREVSPKNGFTFGLSMLFAHQAAYDHYNHHPDHVNFVENVWLKEVDDFLEIDTVPYNP